MLYISVNENDFIRAFEQAGREDQFSREALERLFEYYNDDSAEDMELDVIAICCDWTEESAEDALESYDKSIPDEWDDEWDDEERAEYAAAALMDCTVTYPLENGNVLYLAF